MRLSILIGVICLSAEIPAFAATAASIARVSGEYRFETNRGQFDSRIRYLARGSGYGLFLNADGATLALRRPRLGTAVLRMRLAGGRPVGPEGEGELGGRSNYFIGSDPAAWRLGVPSYAAVRYRDVLPGVDLRFHGTDDRQTEYDLVLAPLVDPRGVVLTFEGIDGIVIDADGSAVLRLAGGGTVRKPAPVAYQTDAAGARTPVAARYQKVGRKGLRFALGRYDRRQALTIDPVFAYSTLLGGGATESSNGIAVDGAGNVYVAGFTSSADFPTLNAVQPTNRNTAAGNAFVAKLSASGGPSLVYATYLGGSAPAADDRALAIAVDAGGNAYLTGGTAAPDFPTTAGALQSVFHGVQDAFVTKLAASGAALVYSTFLGGVNEDFGCGIAVDGSGNAYLTGQTHSSDFPISATAVQPTKKSTADFAGVFVTKLGPTGSGLGYSTFIGGSTEELCGGIAIASSGNAYVTGSTSSSDFPLKTPLQNVSGGITDAFAAELNATGTALVYSTFLGGAASDFGNGIALDGTGNAFVTGTTASTNFPLKSALQTTNNTAGNFTAFVSKLNTAGSALVYSTYLGGTTFDFGSAVAADGAGNAYVTGFTSSSDFRSSSALQTFGGLTDAFVSAFNPAGSALLYSTFLGGADNDAGNAIAADAAGSVYVSGQSSSLNFPTPASALQPFLHGSSDAFVTKLAASGTFPPIKPKTKSDAFLLAAGTAASTGCGGVAFDGARTLAVTDVNGDGLVCPGCGTGNTYPAADALDFIRLAFYGVHHDTAKTRNCGSDVRRTMLNDYSRVFESACASGACAGKPVHHLWRPSETSAALDTFNGLLGTTTAQFCNVDTAAVIASQGTDFLDNDPIRVTCDGTGKTGEQVCGSAVSGHTNNLGMLLTIFIPSPTDAADIYPLNFCTPGALMFLEATKTTYTGLCPSGGPSFGGKCLSSIYRVTEADGTLTVNANCIQYTQTVACPILTPPGTDCRGANLWLRNADGTLVHDTTFAPGTVPPLTGRFVTGSFFKMHTTVAEPTGTGTCSTAETSSQQIACLVGSADPCSMGLVTRKEVGTPPPPGIQGLAVKGVVPDDPGVFYGTYPLSF